MSILSKNEIDYKHYRLIQVLLALYLIGFYLINFSYVEFLYSESKMVTSHSVISFIPFYSDILTIFDHGWFVYGFMFLQVIAAICLMRNTYPQFMSIFLWVGFVILYHRNSFTDNVSMGYIGYFLLLFVLIGPHSFGKSWHLARKGTYVVCGLAYFVSGLSKLRSSFWQDGMALEYTLSGFWARAHWLNDLILLLPSLVLNVLSWIVVGLELLGILLAWDNRFRFYLWILLTFLQLGIFITMTLGPISIFMIIVHLFLWDPKWNNHRSLEGNSVSTS